MKICILLIAISFLASCGTTQKFRIDTPLYGEVSFSDTAVRKTAPSVGKVKVVYGKLLRGFYLDDEGGIEVSNGYKHKVIGPINIFSNEEQELSNSADKRQFTLEMLKQMREKAFSMGANAVIYAQADSSAKKPTSTGYAVIVKKKKTRKKRRVASKRYE